MPGQQARDLSPGTEDLRDRHHLVFSPATPPLGRESDRRITADFDTFANGDCAFLDLVIRVADPETMHAHPETPYWSRVRVYPDRTSVRRTGHVQCSFSGTAYLLTQEGNETGPQLVCTVTLDIDDRQAGSQIGELAMSNTGGTA